jgi:chaperone modulatory protein CbpM
MADKQQTSVSAEIVNETTTCSVEELCRACGADANWIAMIVEHGVIEPISGDQTTWKFTTISAVRAAKARRLERDLDLNVPGIAVVLDLLDEIERLKARLKIVE